MVMDAFDAIQDQLSRMNHNLNSGLNKIHKEIDQLNSRVQNLERNTLYNDIQSQLDLIRRKVELIPSIKDTQIGTLETLLIGHQYQYRRLSNIISKDSARLDYGSKQENEELDGEEEDEDEDEGHLGSRIDFEEAEVNGTDRDQKIKSNTTSAQPSSRSRVHDLNSTHTAETSLNIEDTNKLINSKLPNGNNHNEVNSNNRSQGININNRVNIRPANLSLISESQHLQSQQPQTQQSTRQPNRPLANLSALRSYTSIGSLENDISISPPIDESESNTVLDQVNSSALFSGGRRSVWDSIPFTRLNPSPSSVQDVLEEYYYGFEGQPPLRFLEEQRKKWRFKDKNLSKSFTRRYRIVVAVEAGISQYIRDFGLTESQAREKVINELEDSRERSNGRKQTMYWLFHNLPSHLRKPYNSSI